MKNKGPIIFVVIMIILLAFGVYLDTRQAYESGYAQGMGQGHDDIINMIALSGSIPLRVTNNNTDINENLTWVSIKDICFSILQNAQPQESYSFGGETK